MEQNIEKLRLSSALIEYDRALVSASKTILYFGVIVALVGGISALRGPQGWAWVAGGIVLLGEGVFVRRVRTPAALLLAGITFAAFALWLVGGFALVLLTKDASYGGRGIVGAIFLSIGAWNLLTSYRSYKVLLEHADPLVSEGLRSVLEEMRGARLESPSGIVEFKLRAFGEDGVWRLKPEGNLVCSRRDATPT
jgi:hypothetical protein